MGSSTMLESVYTVHEYYDGPRQGVATLSGQPVFYDCILSESFSDYTDQYQLTPLPLDILPLVLEDWAIWKRWELAFARGETTVDLHPALPSDKERKQELVGILAPYLQTDISKCTFRNGKFQVVEGPPNHTGTMREMQVEWTECDEKGHSETTSIWR